MKIKINNFNIVYKGKTRCQLLSYATIPVIDRLTLTDMGFSIAERGTYYEWVIQAAGRNNPEIVLPDTKTNINLSQKLQEHGWVSILDEVNASGRPGGYLQESGGIQQILPGVQINKLINKKINKNINIPPPKEEEQKIKEFQTIWNKYRFSKCTKITDKRREAIGKALKDQPDLSWWEQVFKNMDSNPYFRGDGGKRPPADIEWILKDDNALVQYEKGPQKEETKYDSAGRKIHMTLYPCE